MSLKSNLPQGDDQNLMKKIRNVQERGAEK